MYYSDWPRQQLLQDLHSLARVCSDAIPVIAGKADMRVELPLQAALASPDLKLETGDAYLDVLAALNRAALDRSLPQAATFALACLLADVLHGQVGPEAEALGWPDFRSWMVALPRAHRATLARGFLGAADHRHLDLPDPPDRTARQSQDTNAVIAALVPLARRLGAAINAVANADYGMDADRHKASLLAVLDDKECRFPQSDQWYPAEVVELSGHVPGTAEYLPCIALLILDDIHRFGEFDQMTFRWMNHSGTFLNAPDDWRDPILRGIRHVMESDIPGAWDPYFESRRAKIAEKADFVPWFDDVPVPSAA